MQQWGGLLTAAVSFPELNNASTALATSLAYLQTLLDSGVYPDGVETEQASGYDMSTAADFFNVLTQLAYDGASEPPPAFAQRVENMWAFGTYSSDPAGCLPRNGDTDICDGGVNANITAFFKRDDWTYVQTHGAAGTLPAFAPSSGPGVIFPWAGQVIMRSGYGVNATWAWFDVGPYGSSGHAHRDKLQVMLHARGAMLLVDSGRFAYQGTDLSAVLHRGYAGNTSAHNTLCLSDYPARPGSWCDQQAAPAVAAAPVGNDTWAFTPAADWATGSQSLWSGLTGSATHTRSVHYQRAPGSVTPGGAWTDAGSGDDGDWLVVIDAVTSDAPRHIMASWHAHPNASVALDAATGVATVGGASQSTWEPLPAQACVVPAPGGGPVTPGWGSATYIRGQVANASTGTPWQGWFSGGYDDAWASGTLEYRADLAAAGTTYFGWLLVPTATGAVPCAGSSIALLSATPTAVTVSVTVASAGISGLKLTVPIAPPKAA
jgi:hypothetical protein